MVFIRTDANETIATGHVMRCMTIAKELVKLGEKITFLVSDEESARLIKQNGFTYINLNSDWQNPANDQEIKKVRKILAGEKSTLLMDSYMIHADYAQKLNDLAKTVYIDDLFEEKYPVDMLINYTLYHTMFDYEKRYAGIGTKLLLGGKYVPLREEFAAGRKTLVSTMELNKSDKIKVMIVCGGGDKFNAMGGILQYINCLSKVWNDRYMYYVVAGAYNPNKEQLYQCAKENLNICVLENVTDMAHLMAQCDIAVSAASTILYECCAIQLPTIFFCVADNQKYDRECWTNDEVMVYAGDIRSDKQGTIENIVNEIDRLASSLTLREEMQKKMQSVVDGQGAKRIAAEILNMKGWYICNKRE